MAASFSRTVKEEIVFNDFEPCCEKAIIAALIKINGTLMVTSEGLSISIRTENAKIASKIFKILKELYQPTIEFKVTRKMKLKKNNIYEVRITKAKEILNDLGLLVGLGITDVPQGTLTKKTCCKRAFLAGAFLASGSVNAPTKSNYHLEISLANEELAQYVQFLMNKFDLNAKIIKRRNRYIVYLKSAEKIGYFLGLVGAGGSYMKFETTIIDRDFMNSLNRVENCKIANEEKTISAANKQIVNIEIVEKYLGLDLLDEKTRRIANLRLENPEMNLNELAEVYYEQTGETISKSGIHHQLAKIQKEAERLSAIHEQD